MENCSQNAITGVGQEPLQPNMGMGEYHNVPDRVRVEHWLPAVSGHLDPQLDTKILRL